VGAGIVEEVAGIVAGTVEVVARQHPCKVAITSEGAAAVGTAVVGIAVEGT